MSVALVSGSALTYKLTWLSPALFELPLSLFLQFKESSSTRCCCVKQPDEKRYHEPQIPRFYRGSLKCK